MSPRLWHNPHMPGLLSAGEKKLRSGRCDNDHVWSCKVYFSEFKCRFKLGITLELCHKFRPSFQSSKILRSDNTENTSNQIKSKCITAQITIHSTHPSSITGLCIVSVIDTNHFSYLFFFFFSSFFFHVPCFFSCSTWIHSCYDTQTGEWFNPWGMWNLAK